MSTDGIEINECSGCHEPTQDLIGGERVACSNCGCFGRILKEDLHEHVGAHEGFNLKLKRPGVSGGPICTEVSKVEVFRDTGELRRVQMVTDRENNLYFKKVTAVGTGEVRWHCEEPLSDHQNRGSAKPKSGAAPVSDIEEK